MNNVFLELLSDTVMRLKPTAFLSHLARKKDISALLFESIAPSSRFIPQAEHVVVVPKLSTTGDITTGRTTICRGRARLEG